MKNEYSVIVKNSQSNAQSVTHAVPAPGSFWGALKIKATPGARYQLVDQTTGKGPDNIRVKRVGKDLRISFEGRENVDVMITDYYEHAGNEGLTGESERDVLHVYVPESGDSAQLLGRLTDGANSAGFALGQTQWMASSGAAVGALVAVAGFNPLLAAPLALLAVAGAGGGGSGSGSGGGNNSGNDSASQVVAQAARLNPADDTGVSNSDSITSDNTPSLLVEADPGAIEVVVTLNGQKYTSTTKNPQGQFVVPITDPLANGVYAYTVEVKNVAGVLGPSMAGTPFTVDRSGVDDFPGNVISAANKDVPVQIVDISNDTGSSRTDFVTSDNTLAFTGSVGSAFNNSIQNFVEVKLLNNAQQVMASQFLRPENIGGAWKWRWDNSNQQLADGNYQLTAQMVDAAGNPVSQAPTTQAIVIDTNANPDPNAGFPIAIRRMVQDSGTSSDDFLTNQRNLTFEGNIGTTNVGFSGKVLVQVLGVNGRVIFQNHLDANASGNWSFDNTMNTLGVDTQNTQYVLKASILDLAGNILKSTDQSFTVDLKDPIFTISGGSTSGDPLLFTPSSKLTLKPGLKGADDRFTNVERGEFSYFSDGNLISAPNPNSTGPVLTFEPNKFKIVYKDLAGNSFEFTNSDKSWAFSAGIEVGDIPTTNPSPSTFGSGEMAGSIGRLTFDATFQTLDLSSRYSKSPSIGDVAAINHIVMTDSAGNDTLKLTTADVLQLGVKNSFLSNDRQQMRIDGDSGDRVELDDLLGGSSFAWTKAPAPVLLNALNYDVYGNTDLNLELFIQQTITTQVL